MMRALLLVSIAIGARGCTPSDTTLCMTVNIFAGESGHYELKGYTGPVPDITVQIGKTYVFDQSDVTNWYHPVGFAYYPDGAHGATWGGEERDEVERAGELLYKIDGSETTCPDAGDTGLDCYEPEFFYPRGDWMNKVYTAELTITQDMADESHGGVIYYFCHIHSKMSGKIIIQNTDGTPFQPSAKPTPLSLYEPVYRDPFDVMCGTTGASLYSDGGAKSCAESFLPGTLDTVYESCLQAIDCQMNREMRVAGYDFHANPIATFMQQMIPHHNNAVAMSKVLLKHAPEEAAAVEDLEGILWEIINVQNFQVHKFRNYLGSITPTSAGSCYDVDADVTTCDVTESDCSGDWYEPGYISAITGCCHCSSSCQSYNADCIYYDDAAPHSVHLIGHHCDSSLESDTNIVASSLPPTAAASVDGCTASDTTLCMKVNLLIGETGYYEFAGYTGPSPDITVQIGKTYVFDQRDSTNWYHPVGFAYYPDGAHGAKWGGEERDEVEGAGELLYKIDGAETTCPDAGDTGLDCYEPEFFYPRGVWMEKVYTAELTITQDMADKSHGGVIYYFCHIHSKMSGRIIIQNADGTPFQPSANPSPLSLYSPYVPGGVDSTCGTYEVEAYAGGGEKACQERFICGSLDTTFEKCMQAIDCKMNREMKTETSADHTDKVAVFMQQMIPHHQNAINMARILQKQVPAENIDAVEDLTDILQNMINVQNYQIHQFRNYLGSANSVGQSIKCGDLKAHYRQQSCCGNPNKIVDIPLPTAM